MKSTKQFALLFGLALSAAGFAVASPVTISTVITGWQYDAAILGGADPATFLAAFDVIPLGTPFSNFALIFVPPNWDVSADVDFAFIPQYPPQYPPLIIPPVPPACNDCGGVPDDPEHGHAHDWYPPQDPPECGDQGPGIPDAGVPESGTAGLVLVGISGLLWLRRRLAERQGA